MSMKQAATELLKIADEIEAQAENVTQFVCNSCHHTATLAKINEKRKAAASSSGENVVVNDVTVNDQVACPACDDGVMAYVATDESKKFYIEEKVADGAEDTVEHEKGESAEEEAAEQAEKPEEEGSKEKITEKPVKKEKKEEEGKEASSEPIDYDSLKRYRS